MKLFVGIVICIFIAACNSPIGNFTVSEPNGWIVKDSISKKFGKSVLMHPAFQSSVPIFVENIRVSIINFPSLSIYLDRTFANLKERSFYFKKLDNGLLRVNGNDFEWERHIIQNSLESEQVEQKNYFYSESGNIYQFVCTSKIDSMERLQPNIDKVLQSFKVVK